MGRSIVEQINDKDVYMGNELVLNTSYDIFFLGKDISKYEQLIHCINHYVDPNLYDIYEIEIHGYIIELWCEDNHIDSICCRESCIYKGMELVNMKYEDFVNIIQEEPLKHEILYVPIKENWGQNQHVYEFDKSGLQVWVWRGKVRTIIIYDTNAYEEQRGRL